MSQLNANEIAVLAMCYAGHPSPTDDKGEVFTWVKNARLQLERLDMVDSARNVTERGGVFMDHLVSLELPKKTWSMA